MAKAKEKTVKPETASSMASRIREIAVSEFFSKNRHLLGFDSPLKSLLTAVREGVDNALDACEEAAILPDILVKISQKTDNYFEIYIEDNGPGIVKSHVANIFGKLLYGSKFHRLKQSRGQQGIGISAAVMYGQMTTGNPAVIVTKTAKEKEVHQITLQLDTKKNAPKVLKDIILKDSKWEQKRSGTSITLTLEGAYKDSKHGVLSYLSQTALANPHASFTYIDPKGEIFRFPRLVNSAGDAPKEIQPHPHGVELGTLMQFLQEAKNKPLAQFLKNEFSRVSDGIADEICKKAGLSARIVSSSLDREKAQALYDAIQQTKIMAPPTNCLSPMHEESILKALYWLFVESKKWDAEELLQNADSVSPTIQEVVQVKEEISSKKGKKGPSQPELLFAAKEEGQQDGKDDPLSAIKQINIDQDGSLAKEGDYFVTAVTRPPNVYRGNPFQVEVGLFYGKDLKADALAQVYRYANRVPLQYQASACAMTKAVLSVPWRSYGLQQSKGALPTGPLVIMMHIASVWVPYTSESKEAIAHYPEIMKELRLALMECGRRLQQFIRRRKRQADEAQKKSYITKYLDPIAEALRDILQLSEAERQSVSEGLKEILERTRDKSAKEEKVKPSRKALAAGDSDE